MIEGWGIVSCCVNCFNDEYVKVFINRKGVISKCDYCNAVDVKCISEIELYDMFHNVFDLYCIINDEYYYAARRKKDCPQPETLISLIQHDWSIFNTSELNGERIAELIYNISMGNPNIAIKPSEVLDNIWVRKSEKYFGYFISRDWNNFCKSIKHEYRFFHDYSENIEFEIERTFDYKTFEYAERLIDSSKILYRGREGYLFDKNTNAIKPYRVKDMGIPGQNIISNGRANPNGINYLYTADDIPTVLSEIRSWKGAIVSVAKIEIRKTLKIVDLTNIFEIKSPFQMEFNNLRKDIESVEILKMFGNELTKPVNPKYSPVDYIPTQFICELIRSKGYDGIMFKSSLGEGSNVVLFDMKKIKIKDVELYKVKEIKYEPEKYNI